MRHGSLSQTVIERALVAPLYYFQAIQTASWGKSLEIVIITKHAQDAEDTEVNPHAKRNMGYAESIFYRKPTI